MTYFGIHFHSYIKKMAGNLSFYFSLIVNFCYPKLSSNSLSISSSCNYFKVVCFSIFCLVGIIVFWMGKVQQWICCPDKYMLVASVGPWRHNKWAALSTPFSTPHTPRFKIWKCLRKNVKTLFPPSRTFPWYPSPRAVRQAHTILIIP